jgi:hypothetical protein
MLGQLAASGSIDAQISKTSIDFSSIDPLRIDEQARRAHMRSNRQKRAQNAFARVDAI